MTLARVTTWIDGQTLTAAALNGEFDNILQNPTQLISVQTDRLLGRDAAGTGNIEQLSVTNGLAFTGSTSIGIANDGVTYARMQNTAAASRFLGRGSASGAGDLEELATGTSLQISGTTVNVLARSIMQFKASLVAGGATVFMGVDSDVSEAVIWMASPIAGAILSLNTIASQPGGIQTYTYTLRVASANTALTHVVTGAAFQGNTAGNVAVAVGDILSVRLVTSATATTSNHSATIVIAAG